MTITEPWISDEQAMLRTVLEYPFDDTVRLIFADWLEENGQHVKAECLREQIGCPSIDRSIHHIEYMTAIYRTRSRNELITGLPHRIELNTADFLTHAKAIFSRWPIVEVGLRDYYRAEIAYLDRPVIFGRHYPNWHRLPDFIKRIPTRFETGRHAVEHISRACVDYGRSLAGLRPIDWQTEAQP